VDVVQELETASDHIRSLGLCLSIDKTQAVVFASCYRTVVPLILLEGEAVRLIASMKYLGIKFKCKRTMFGAHVQAAADKAQRVMGALGRLMLNVGGQSENRRRLFVIVLLYGALA